MINVNVLPFVYTRRNLNLRASPMPHSSLLANDTCSVPSKHKLRVVSKLAYLGSFIMAYQYALEKVGKEAPHTGNTLLRLLARVEQENQLFFHSPTLSAELNIPRTTLENHFRKLLEIGAIVPDPKQENNSRGIVLWRVCPYLVWSGTGEKMRDYLASLPATHPFHSFQDPNIAGA
jgi:hypothetical protein